MNRKDFIIKSGLVSAAIITPYGFNGNRLSNLHKNSTLHIGIIGTGDRGGGAIPLINGIQNCKVVACCDILPFRLEDSLSKVDGKANGYKDYRYLLDNKDVDAVFVATPFNTHSKIAIDSLDAGKHVYCEKTMAKGFKGISQLREKQSTSKKVFQTGHQYRSSRLYRHVANLIKEGKVGTIQTVECQWNRNGDWRRPVPKPEYEKIINWRMYREFSGGLLAELCSHQLDFVNWILDAMPHRVMGVGGIDYWKDGRETYDNVHLIYNYPNGVKAKFTCLTANAKDGYKIKVIGDKGTIILDYARAWFYPEGNYNRELGEVDGVSGATVSWVEGKGTPIELEHTEPTLQALIDFRDNVVDNIKPFSYVTTGANAAICVQMGLDAMYEDKIIYNQDKG